MKTLTWIKTLAVALGTTAALTNATGAMTNPVSARLTEASSRGQIATVVALLPEVEKLWPQDPKGYYEAAHTAARSLESVWRTDASARRALTTFFTNALQKSCPSAPETELSCLEGKWNVAMTAVNLVIESGQEPLVSALAQYLGEVRQQRIPNYESRGSKIPPAALAVLDRAGVRNAASLKSATDRAEYEKAMEQNRRDLQMNRVQSLLSRIDQTLSSRLIQACARFSSGDGKNAAFLDQIASAARLTADERKGL